MRTEQEIKKMVNALNEDRDSVPELSIFGDQNWKAMDAQVEALEWVLGERDAEEVSDSYEEG